MALTATSFISDRPEFASAGVKLVASTMADARLRVSAAEYVGAYDDALSLMTAHLLWDSPFGASMRRDGGQDAASPYWTELAKLKLERIPRIGVL
jgi:Protein of unknown function (DUF4054)